MIKRYSEDYLRDIEEAIKLAIEFTEGMNFDEFCQDKKTIFAVARAIQIIGEAIKKLPDNIRQQYPQIPWKDIAKMRDKVTHQYFSVKLDVLWDTVKQDLPLLQSLISSVLDNLKE
ncbi:HepT-like ribonuclease domain-containing protein [Aphanothece sacrum]|uniref:DUF86 domain-containing protein n=1 Tax=Aphanothece sacrum FPU1 TaxID=1920663 RepID=A0A401IHC3_APHSA|nr:DUF86 domain-containing protein [Aphanothece sacrum]GBF80551.1 hypothetical protein AsFPU1_1952 [Aphanothece sacrum FPU1]GBF84651.1 hypothetical protein AsFPU3_1703 [Aphanothece sacrum FPU3]